MKINPIVKLLGSGFYTGYIPYASGTFASLLAVLIYLFVPGFHIPLVHILVLSIVIVIGIPISAKFEEIYGKDPKECTIDEFAGTWISLLFIPKNIIFVVAIFILWRVADILKPYPANIAENLEGGIGVMLDDIIAAVYVFIFSHLILHFII